MFFAKIKTPPGIYYLYGIDALITFSYAVLFSSLALYLTTSLGLSQVSSNNIVGLFLACNFALHLLSGYIGGRFLSYRLLFLISILFQIIGITILSFTSLKFFWGLSFFVMGTGINSTCLNCILTQQLTDFDDQRETVFFINYCAMNIGFFAGFSVSGFFDIHHNYKLLFYYSNLVTLLALLLLILAWQYIPDKDTPLSLDKKKIKRQLFGFLLLILSIPTLLISFQQTNFSNPLILTLGSGSLAAIFILALLNKSPVEQSNLYTYLIFALASIIFWMLFYVGPMGVTQFLKHNTAAQILGYPIPPQWIMNLNSIFIIIGSPFFAYSFAKLKKRGMAISIAKQFSLALLLIAFSFYVLSLGIYYASEQGFIHIGWIILHFLLQALGELMIGPIGYAMIGKLAPSNLQGIMMGIWMMIPGISAILSSHFSNIMTKSEAVNPLISNPDYLKAFNELGFYSFIATVILIIISSRLDKFIHRIVPATI